MNKGFTLIELLVVIAVISILSGVVLANLWTARNKGSDTKRMADVDQLAVSARLYYERYGSFPAYDQDVGVGNDIDDDLGQFIHVSTDDSSPDKDYHYDNSQSCPLAGGNKVVVYAVMDDEDNANWQDACNSSGPDDRYIRIVN